MSPGHQSLQNVFISISPSGSFHSNDESIDGHGDLNMDNRPNVNHDSDDELEVNSFLHMNNSSTDDSFDEFEGKDFQTLMDELTEQWMSVEVDHHVSKTATDAFWRLALNHFYPLIKLKHIQGVRRKIPLFSQLRKNLKQQHVPPIKMDFGYVNNTTGALEEVKNVLHTPVAKYLPDNFKKVYEIGKIEAS